MKKGPKIALACCLVLTILFASCWAAIGLYAWVRSQDPGSNTEEETKNADIETPSMGRSNINIQSIQIESINNSDINSIEPTQAQVNEVLLARDAFRLVKNTSWSGNKNDSLPITISDFDQSKLRDYIDNQEAKSDLLTIPSEIEDVFSSSKSANEIQSLMLLSRQEYMEYLDAKNVSSKYINEIDTNALPKDQTRLEYFPENNPDAAPTSAGGSILDEEGNRDYSKTSISLYAVDVFNVAGNICDSRIFGEPNGDSDQDYWEKCRNMAVRQLMYHEMTHVLQRAYTSEHVSTEHKSDKSAYVFADKTLVDVDEQYFWEWGGSSIIQTSNNRQVSQESQADGISFEMLANNYDMSKEQKEALWDHMFGRLTNTRVALDEIQNTVEAKWPNFSPDESGSLIKAIMQDYNRNGESTLVSLTNRMIGFPAYVGYMNPMEPEDTHLFWDFLQN